VLDPAHDDWSPVEEGSDAGISDGNRIVHGDNLEILSALMATHAAQIDLVYIDPPFASGVDRRQVDRSAVHEDASSFGEKEAYGDTWSSGLEEYLVFMEHRIRLIHGLLKPTGSFLLHCDYRASPYLSLLCDEIFGMGARQPGGAKNPGYRNEIIWHYGLGGSSPRNYPRKHDVILWYSRSGDWFFDPPMIPATSQRLKGKMKKCPDVWHIPSINNMAKERTGYPTQKPIELLNRIIGAHARPGDLVLDAFMGSGTTLVAAERAGRRWIGCDSGDLSVQVVTARIQSERRSQRVLLHSQDGALLDQI